MFQSPRPYPFDQDLTCISLHLLHHVILDGGTTIILRRVPFQTASFLMDVGNLQRSLWFAWFVQDGDIDDGFIFTRVVLGLDGVRSGVVSVK